MYSFKAKIYKVGINLCVKVPFRITEKMIATKGYIPVKGKINGHPFEQTLCPVKGEEYRLYVNGLMLKGGKAAQGDTASFSIEQSVAKKAEDYPMPAAFKKRLSAEKLLPAFKKLTPSRQKEILRYMNYLKTEESVLRNVEKVINELREL